MKIINELTTSEVVNLLEDKDVKIIDVRPADAYNGWKLKNESRGGHIKGAKSLPAKWAEYMDWIEVVRHKQIEPSNRLVIYGYDTRDSQRVAELFVKAGYPDVSVYKHFIKEWSGKKQMPMEHLARFRQLVHREWVERIVDGEIPEDLEVGLLSFAMPIIATGMPT